MNQARPFSYAASGRQMQCDRMPMEDLARRFGTPLYVYSASFIRDRYRQFDTAFKSIAHDICYSVKANSNLSLLKQLAKLGSGFDVVSGGELERVLKVSRSAAKKTVFSGVGKTAGEIDAALKAGIFAFNVEGQSELELLGLRAAALRKKARIALRVNPDVSADTHPYISTGLRQHKFGVAIAEARNIYRGAAGQKWLEVAGVSVHIGSQITSVEPFAAAMERVAELVHALNSDGHRIRYVDAGGGLGIHYSGEEEHIFAHRLNAYAKAVVTPLKPLKVRLLLEPGRAIVGPAGALLTRVLYLKQNGAKRFVVVDAGMNDLIRPSLYDAHHEIVPVRAQHLEHMRDKHAAGLLRQLMGAPARSSMGAVDVVGPVCETGDFFAHDREMPPVQPGDLLAILDTGAYGMSLASNYNSRGRPAEVLVDGKSAKLIRRRETMKDMLAPEL